MKKTVPILLLNRANVERFFAARRQGSTRAMRDASRIVADVRKRGDEQWLLGRGNSIA